mgnify:CR=1 FL=1
MPVFPEVASRIVLPGAQSAAGLTFENHARGGAILDGSPGFCHSAFAQSSTPGVSTSIRWRRTSGVLPMRSRTEDPTRSAVFKAEGEEAI